MQAKGTANDSISSVKVAPGYKVTFYRANGFGGVTLVKTANDSTFTDDKVTGTKYTNWDNEASSMKVERVEEQPTCVDSDGGDNPDVAGYLTFNGQKYGEDFCYTQDSGYYGYVGESFCINNGAGTSTSNPRKCDYGCENGACKPAPQTSITVTSPNGGETWVNEQTMQIRWSAQNIPSDASYTINIYNGTNTSSYNKTIISGLAYGTTSYTWTVEGNNGKNGFGLGYEKSLWQKIADLIIPTAHAAAGTDKYIIQVCAGGVCGESGIFAINLTNFVMISPNGGETFTVGQNLAINWNSGGLLSSDSLSIWLLDYKNGDIPVSTQIATGLPGDIKSYNYLIPDITPSSKFLVDIEVLRNGIMIARGLSANYFTIKEATVSCPGYLDNYVVLNSGRYSNGTVSFNLTNTTSSTQTIAISIGSGSISKSSITIPSGTCASPDSITYSSSSDTTITFTNSGRTIASFPVVATSQTSCTDTDGGKDYFTKGTVTSRTGSSTDLCYSAEGRIAEYYCSPEGYRVYEWYTCPNGCSNGACIQTQSYNNQNTLNSMAAALANIAAQLKQLLGR